MKSTVSLEKLNTIKEGFYIETTTNEVIKITPQNIGFLFEDVTPPVFQNLMQEFDSITMKDNDIRKLSNHPYGQPTPEHLYVKGIKKGFYLRFKWMDEDEYLISRGKIEKLYYKEKAANFNLNIHLFDLPGIKYYLDDFFGGNFKIRTDMSDYQFVSDGEDYIFEDKKVLGIFSFQKNLNYTVENLASEQSCDVSAHLVFKNKPFAVATHDGKKVNFSLINENVIEVVKI